MTIQIIHKISIIFYIIYLNQMTQLFGVVDVNSLCNGEQSLTTKTLPKNQLEQRATKFGSIKQYEKRKRQDFNNRKRSIANHSSQNDLRSNRNMKRQEPKNQLNNYDQSIIIRTQKYLENCLGISLQNYFSPKILPNYSDRNLIIIKNKLHIYGVDMISPKSIYNYFSYFLPENIKMVTCAAANVEFQTQLSARRALYSNLRHKNNLNKKSNNSISKGSLNSGDQFDPFLPDTPMSLTEQYQLIPYFVMGIQRRIYARFATNIDEPNQSIKLDEMYIKFLKAKKNYNQFGTKKFHRENNDLKQQHKESSAERAILLNSGNVNKFLRQQSKKQLRNSRGHNEKFNTKKQYIDYKSKRNQRSRDRESEQQEFRMFRYLRKLLKITK